jgi:hypothetical protein
LVRSITASLIPPLNGLHDVDLQNAIHNFSATEVTTSTRFPRFFNHYGPVYELHGDGSMGRRATGTTSPAHCPHLICRGVARRMPPSSAEEFFIHQ